MRAASAASALPAPPASSGSPAQALPPGGRLPPAVVQGIPLRVSVLGTRGKGTLAAAAAAALRRRGLTVHTNAPRSAAGGQGPEAPAWRRQAAAFGLPAGDQAVIAATAQQVRAAWPMQALVLANRARSEAGMRRLHAEVGMPHYVLVTNVRRDPSGLSVKPLPAEARRLARSITPGALVVCGEPDPQVRALLRRECERSSLAFLDAAPRRAMPGAEVLSVLDAFLLHRFGKGLEADEEAALRQEFQARFRWQPSSLPGVRWFEGGSLHDVDTTQIALNHLQGQKRLPVTFVVYLRADRPGRTRAYQGFLAELLAAPDTRQVVLCGHRAQAVADRLQAWAAQVRVVPDDVAALPRVVRRLQFDCQGGAIVTLANHRGAWPEELARLLARPAQRAPAPAPVPIAAPVAQPLPASPVQGPATGVANPAAAGAGLMVPKRIVRPLVAAAAVPSAQMAFAMPPGVTVPLAAAAAALPSAPGGARLQDLR